MQPLPTGLTNGSIVSGQPQQPYYLPPNVTYPHQINQSTIRPMMPMTNAIGQYPGVLPYNAISNPMITTTTTSFPVNGVPLFTPGVAPINSQTPSRKRQLEDAEVPPAKKFKEDVKEVPLNLSLQFPPALLEDKKPNLMNPHSSATLNGFSSYPSGLTSIHPTAAFKPRLHPTSKCEANKICEGQRFARSLGRLLPRAPSPIGAYSTISSASTGNPQDDLIAQLADGLVAKYYRKNSVSITHGDQMPFVVSCKEHVREVTEKEEQKNIQRPQFASLFPRETMKERSQIGTSHCNGHEWHQSKQLAINQSSKDRMSRLSQNCVFEFACYALDTHDDLTPMFEEFERRSRSESSCPNSATPLENQDGSANLVGTLLKAAEFVGSALPLPPPELEAVKNSS